MAQTAKNTRTFKGTSDNFNLAEALTIAITQAKEALKQDFLSWELVSMTGHDGGFINETKLTVVIRVAATPAGTKAAAESPILLSQALQPQAALAGASELVKLSSDGGDVYVEFTLDTKADWDSSMLPTVGVEHQTAGAIRKERVGSVAELVHAGRTWVITVENTLAGQATTYTGSVELTQEQDGTTIYTYPLNGSVKDGASAIERGVITFY